MTDATPLAWIGDSYEVHCLVLAQHVAGRELLMRLGGAPAEMFLPQDEDEANEFLWAGMEDYWSWGAARVGEAGSWAFCLEPASIWASNSTRLKVASRGTEAMCCFTSDGVEFVEYWRDGVLITGVDTAVPHERARKGGTDPDFLVAPMERVGLLGAGASAHRPGLALLHEVTGVVLDAERTTLTLTGKLPAEGLGPEKAAAEQTGSGAAAPSGTGGMGGAVGGPVGAPSEPRPAGTAKTSGGCGLAGS
ncbi:DUF6461 domain-containing protein [Streptomyces platensis]|uniref:DUF6461 domain-containing protein n=1 Tax=Streptomyces platensis TaxID=58346 RepID=UPI002F90F24C|nr:DUF6461 domain-containing protein [Streptomyces platensis]